MISVITFKDKILSSMDIDTLEIMSRQLCIPFYLISSHDKADLDNLKGIINKFLEHPPQTIANPIPLGEFEELVTELVAEMDVTILLERDYLMEKVPKRWIISSILMNNRNTNNLWPVWLVNKVQGYIGQRNLKSEDVSVQLISYHYNFIERLVNDAKLDGYLPIRSKIGIDQYLLDSRIGFIIFALIMWAVFKITFDVSAPISAALDGLINYLANMVRDTVANELIASFLADAVIGGVGFVLVFIPQIALLFLFISIMEHSGYLTRVVFIFDRFVNRIGISGSSVAPLLLGFGCNVPAIMATRSIKDDNERKALVFVNPFMSCSARLPVYVVISGALFPQIAGTVIVILYFSGILIAILLLAILRRTILKGEPAHLLMELPELSRPPVHLTLSRMWLQVHKFVEKAATWMAIGLIVIWVLSISGPSGYIGPDALHDSELLHSTFIFKIGNFFQPIFSPFGWDSRLIVALFFGFIAKEIVISSFGLIYGISDTSITAVIISQLSPASGLAYIFFVLLYTPCIGTVSTIRQEIGSKWSWFSISMGLVVAYLVSFFVFSLAQRIL